MQFFISFHFFHGFKKCKLWFFSFFLFLWVFNATFYFSFFTSSWTLPSTLCVSNHKISTLLLSLYHFAFIDKENILKSVKFQIKSFCSDQTFDNSVWQIHCHCHVTQLILFSHVFLKFWIKRTVFVYRVHLFLSADH